MRVSQLLLAVLWAASNAEIACASTPAADDILKHGNVPRHVFGLTQISIQQPAVADYDSDAQPRNRYTSRDALQDMIDALEVMQENYFELWQGIWPTAIDWTSAVLGTYLSAALMTLSKSLDYTITSESPVSTTAMTHENLINRYFSQLVSFYFGQDAFALRTEAYDDMLWVVLGWLESIKFIHLHSALHYSEYEHMSASSNTNHKPWHGKQWISSFAHRARIFWDLASQGWDTSLCNGGMIWSPYLTPYKNAITNELFITASISMYLYFPGDQNNSPFISSTTHTGTHDPKYLAAAIEGYKWLTSSNMTNTQGLYVDGFHISGWQRNPPRNQTRHTKCDVKNEMLYTYNQGVLLSGQRGLWEATAARSYLEDGHQLVKGIINATGYDLKHDRTYWDPDRNNDSTPQMPPWYGLGRQGIIEDVCDSSGLCSQDAQTFKGIYFHHLSLFCAPIAPHLMVRCETFNIRDYHDTKIWHEQSCKSYAKWIKRNAEAAISTRTKDGKYGMWWGASQWDHSTSRQQKSQVPDGAVDYRNRGIPDNGVWRDGEEPSHLEYEAADSEVGGQIYQDTGKILTTDANDRGRGRTVETQGGAVSVLRALWEIVEIRS